MYGHTGAHGHARPNNFSTVFRTHLRDGLLDEGDHLVDVILPRTRPGASFAYTALKLVEHSATLFLAEVLGTKVHRKLPLALSSNLEAQVGGRITPGHPNAQK
jgi:hypothetical protein